MINDSSLPDDVEYAGFWLRFGATLLDSVILLLVTLPVMYWIYGLEYWAEDALFISGGWDIAINWVLPVIIVIIFWHTKGATPGKMVTKMQVVDETSGQLPSMNQSIIRYFAYLLSTLPLFLGFFWIAIDPKKQGWHDKLASTVVIKIRHKE